MIPSDPSAPVRGLMKRRPIALVEYLIVHCSATKPHMDIGRAEIDGWHRHRGFDCIGYHYVIRRDGTVEKGRADTDPGAHAENFNARSLGICMAGGIDMDGAPENNFTPAQFESLARLLTRLSAEHPQARVVGHRDLPRVAKACPSFDVQSWWKDQQA